jgi:hypothetical protein
VTTRPRYEHEREPERPPMTVYDHLARQLDRNTDLEDLVRRLFARIEEGNVLLQSALHDLAQYERGQGLSESQFITRWYRNRGRRL